MLFPAMVLPSEPNTATGLWHPAAMSYIQKRPDNQMWQVTTSVATLPDIIIS